MQQYVGITVPDQAAIERHIDAPQAQRPPQTEPVRIVTDADTCSERGRISVKARDEKR
jgi:hypothetical protein